LGQPKEQVLHKIFGHDERGEMRKGGRMYVRRRMEKELDNAWKDKAFSKRVNLVVGKSEADEMRRRCGDDDEKLATLERILKDLSQEESKGEGQRHLLDDASKGVSGAVDAGAVAGTGQTKQESSVANGAALDPEPSQAVHGILRGDIFDSATATGKANTRQRAVQRKAFLQLREPDPQVSPVAKLRNAVYNYQATRDECHGKLEKTLTNQTVKRKQTIAGGASDARNENPEPKEEGHPQNRWYHGMLLQLERLFSEMAVEPMPQAVHSIMDSVRQTLEEGRHFDSQAYFSLLEQLEPRDVTGPVCGVLLTLLNGLGVEQHELVAWFRQNYDEFPGDLLEMQEVVRTVSEQ